MDKGLVDSAELRPVDGKGGTFAVGVYSDRNGVSVLWGGWKVDGCSNRLAAIAVFFA